MKKKILVTGGAGYIGSHTCKALAQAGFDPVVFDNLSAGNEWAVKWGALVKGDLLNEDDLAQAFAQHKPEAVIHFAACAYVGESVDEPEKYYRNNLHGSLNLLSAMRAANCHKIVFSSTCAIFGEPDGLPISEDLPKNPINPYGRTKLAMEGMLEDFDHAYGLKYVALRYFNAAGADPDGEIGEDHDPETHLIPIAIETAMGRRDQMQVFGDDYPTKDGSNVRDYVHVTDLASAHLLALQSLLEGNESDVFNLGNGTGVSVKELIQTVKEVSGRDFPVTIAPRRPGDPAALVAVSTKSREQLGWEPKSSGIQQIVQTAWDWHRGHNSG
ncbi:MAG: UDP-glucose 4-epimerase GalE [Rhodospirillales bacterium]|nr:UDP-glucose 4-epimerase GalE [Rhodospirillales bacterium]